MSAMSEITYRLRALFGRASMERELDDELRFHMEHEIEKHVAAGMPRSEAERLARIAFGGVARIKDDTRDARGITRIENLLQDLRYAWRGIATRPGFAAAIVVTLALGFGANVAMFGIVDRLFFRPPAYLKDADRVHRVYLTWPEYLSPRKERTERTMEFPRYVDLTRWTTSFDKTAVFAARTIAVGDGENAREMTVAAVSATLFDLFGARPAAGRFFGPDEDRVTGGAPVAVLGYSFWQSQYGGRSDVLGETVHVGEGTATIIGVAPRDFTAITDGAAPALFLPVTTIAAAQDTAFYRRYNWGWLEMFARRKSDVSIATADADLTVAYRRSWEVERQLAGRFRNPPVDVAKPRAAIGSVHLSRGPEASQDTKVATWVMGVAVIVLLVACANVANLLLARAVARRREIALRIALGVSRGRLVQQLATESILLAVLGGAAGLAIAQWGGMVMRGLFLRQDEAGAVFTDARTVVFASVATLAVALLTGLAPAIHALRGDLNTAIKGGTHDDVHRRSRIGTALLLFQGALSVVLLVGGGLFIRSLSNVRAMSLGYDATPVVLLSAQIRGTRIGGAAQAALSQRLLAATQATPGVVAATLAASVPFYSNEGRGAPIVAGKDSLDKLGKFLMQTGSPDYFKTVGTRILAGRGFEETDREGTPRVAVISEVMAKAIWPGENAIGKQFRFEGNEALITVVGVAENMRARLLLSSDEIWYYLPVTQEDAASQYPQILARVNGRPEEYLEPLRRRLQAELPAASYMKGMPLQALISNTQRSWQFGATMFIAFGGLALILAGIGLYSVIAYAVAQRTRELGVRIALGASTGRVVRMIVGESVAFAAAGIAIGGAIALYAARWIEPLLFEEPPKDPLVFGIVGLTLLAAAVLAAVRPALRAVSVDPAEVLRAD